MSKDSVRPSQYLSRVAGYSVWIVFTFGFSVLIMYVLTDLMVTLGVRLDGASETVVNVALGSILYAIMLAVAVGLPWLIWRHRTSFMTLGLNRVPSWKDLALTLGGLATYLGFTVVLMMVVANFIPGIDIQQEQDLGGIMPTSSIELLIVFALLVVVGPVVEELMFRGYMYGKIREAGTPAWLTILVVSVLFGAVHLQWNVGIDTFALSVVMCLTREISGTVWPSILMHMSKNGLAFYLLFIVGIS